MKTVLLAWSGGKESAWALRILKQDPEIEVAGLLTTINKAAGRVSMNGVSRELVQEQVRATGMIPWNVELPHPCDDGQYGQIMSNVIEVARLHGISAFAFGDLNQEGVREYRQKHLADRGMEALFPLWGSNTHSLALEMQAAGVKAKVVCVDPKRLDKSFCGREWDAGFLGDLPEGVDPCGEDGEFHTFAYDGPMFLEPLPIQVGATEERDGFIYADLTLK